MSELKFDEFSPNEELNSICEICKGMHKTSRHDEYEIERKESLEPVCEICGGSHKTSRHNFELDKSN